MLGPAAYAPDHGSPAPLSPHAWNGMVSYQGALGDPLSVRGIRPAVYGAGFRAGRAAQPRGEVVDVTRRPHGRARVVAAGPARGAPLQRGQLDTRVAGLGLFHQPPLVAAVAVQVRRRAHVAGLRAVGGVGVATDL